MQPIKSKSQSTKPIPSKKLATTNAVSQQYYAPIKDPTNAAKLNEHSPLIMKPCFISHSSRRQQAINQQSTVQLNKPAKGSAPRTHRSQYPQHPFLTYLNDYPTLAATTNQLLNWDTSLCIHINRYSSYQRIAAFFKTVSRLGDGWFWGVMLLAALLSQYRLGVTGWAVWLPMVTIMLTSSLGVGLYKVLKVKTVRPRPYQVHQVIIMGERPLDVFSFPSGHTLQAVLFTCALGGYFPILLWLMVPFAILVALSRMVLGLHYPTDVAIGALIGAGLAQLSPLIYQLLATMVA
jgi:undecaprenyl-diphosphatase